MKVAGLGPGGHRRGAAPMAEINIIPLVDITLVLLIIFMATTAFVKDQNEQDKSEETVPQLPLLLPQASGAAAIDAPASGDLLILGIDKGGQKFIGGAAVSTESLHERVREAALKNPEGRVRIDADRDTRFQDIVEVIELCQFEGLRNVGLHIAKDNQQ
ncbi:MAG TPA: biopolymer transporter ExbD [Abditibacteriaceae bacterium]